MSSEEPASRNTSRAGAVAATADSSAGSLERRIVEYAQLGVPVAVIAGATIAGLLFGPPGAVLVLASGALIGVIAVFWASLRTLLGETPLTGADAYAIGAPRTEEEQKQAVLRALKDLEFERSVGKISEEDYRELVVKYRAEAKRLLRILEADAGPRRAHVEALVAKRLRRAGIAVDGGKVDGGKAFGDDDVERVERAGIAKKDAEVERAIAETVEVLDQQERVAVEGATVKERACASCATINDEDAVFCKKCGARQPQAAEPESDEDDDVTDGDAADEGDDDAADEGDDEGAAGDRPRTRRGAS